MERLKPAAGEATGSFIGAGQPDPSGVPERLGDFRILREVGRGGMGVVYEAVQESLGRHVALKVLPSHALLNPRHLRRFLREARAAAKLHHTNIVPVFGVGEGNGLHYYVMQFIVGSGLHEIIGELRRIKSASRTTAGGSTRPASSQGLHYVLQGLQPAHLATTAADDGDVAATIAPASADPSAGNSILSASSRDFARQVARVGLQVAQALGYAHAQGVLHRDIKPSNLLHDIQGTVWVADFGLAKSMTGADDLSNEGDVLGTLRYMAPERFRGEADARSDLYALGLTLYELLTLRPAFDQEDRDRLIHQVTTGVPPRPRTLNPEIPRDLETIVLKAIEHEPARRYQDADELADDLQRFLADRPIRARPVGAIERAWKWSRRKPAIAGLLAALAVAVLVGSVGIVSQWSAAVAASRIAEQNAEQSRRNFDHAMRTVDTFCTQVSQEQLFDQPGMLGLRRRLLELALKYYQDFQREQELLEREPGGGGPRLTHKLALSFMHIGMIRNEFGESFEANKALMRAKDLFKELCRASPKDLTILEQLARCCIEIEDVERLNDFEFRYIREIAVNPSIPLTQALVAAAPENPEYLRLRGRSHDLDGLRWLRWRPDSCAEAQAAFEQAVVTLETASRRAPDDIEGVRCLALARAHLGLVHQLTGHHARSVETLTLALDALKPLEERFPKGRRFRLDRAECFVNLGIAQIDLGHYAEAAAALENAERRLVELDRDDLRTADVRYWLAHAKQGLGRVALARGQTGSARQILREAISQIEEASPDSRIGRDYLLLARSYLWLGRTELQAGHPDAVPAIHAKLVEVLKAVGDSLVVGYTVPQQSAAIALLREHAQSMINAARSHEMRPTQGPP
jgi:serine/threonine protein kinase